LVNVRKIVGQKYKNVSNSNLQKAVAIVKNGVLSQRHAANQFGIYSEDYNRKSNKKKLKPIGRPCVLSKIEETMLLDGL
jgi:hypothetical protein